MKNECIFIREKIGKRIQAIRVNCESDIPEFLRKTITVDAEGKATVVLSREHITIRELPLVIMYVRTPNPRCPSGYSAWPLYDMESIVEIDGKFYEKSTKVYKAVMVGETMPEFLNDLVSFRIDDTWYLQTGDGALRYGKIGCAYWRISMSGDIDIIPADKYDEYVICNEGGTVDIDSLA